MKRPYIRAAAALIVATAMLAGCSGNTAGEGVEQAEGKPETLRMLVTPSGSYNILTQLAEKYTAETGIKIEFIEAPSDQLPTKIILAKQGNQAIFDMTMVDGFTMAQVVAAGALVPLDSYLKEDEEYDYDDFPDGLKHYSKVDDISYALPLSTEPYLQWYRTDLFSDLGLEPASDWSTLFDNAAALKQAGHYGYAGVYGSTGSAHYYNAMLASMGHRLLDPETYRPLLDEPIAKEIMEEYLSLLDYSPEASFSSAALDVVNGFSQLDIGQTVLASGHWRTINDPEKSRSAGNVATAQIPLDERGEYEPVSSLYGWLAGISSVSPYQDAAWDFLSWALGKDSVNVFIENNASPPARYSTTGNAEYLESLPTLAAIAEAAEKGMPMVRIPEMPQIVSVLSQDISAIASGQVELDEGMDLAQNHLLNILVQSGRYKGE